LFHSLHGWQQGTAIAKIPQSDVEAIRFERGAPLILRPDKHSDLMTFLAQPSRHIGTCAAMSSRGPGD
jgi:hypothetical protein